MANERGKETTITRSRAGIGEISDAQKAEKKTLWARYAIKNGHYLK